MDPILLSMQAAGMITNWLGMNSANQIARTGANLQQAGINANIALTQTQSADASAQALVNLRKTLGSQIAIQAARGTSSGAGSAMSLMQESIGNFNADERARNLNELSREANLRGQGVMTTMKQQTDQFAASNKFASDLFNKFPTNETEYGEMKKEWGGTMNSIKSGWNQLTQKFSG